MEGPVVVECGALAGPHGASDEQYELFLDQAKCGARSYTPQTLRIKGTNKPQTYGELQPALVATLLRQVRAGPGDTLVDIGSGCGTLCFQAACQSGCAAHGIEIRTDLHEVAGQLAPLVTEQMRSAGLFCGAVRLHCGDVRQPPPELVAALNEATIVVVNNVVFDEPLNQAIFRLLKSVLRQGCRVLSFRDCFPRLRASKDQCVSSDHLLSRFHLPPHQFVSEPNVASWTCSPVRYLIYTVIPPNPVGDFRPGRAAEAGTSEWRSKAAQVAAWRAECAQIARSGVDGEYNEIFVSSGAAAPSRPASTVTKRRKQEKKKPQPRPKRAPAEPAKKRRPHWEYVEEKGFYLPPSPEGKRKKKGALAVVDEIQTRNLNARHKAIIRERPSQDAVEEPRLTRRQRRERGEEVVELRKTVIWNAPDRCEDYCCLCCDGGELLCCDGNCYRSFHLACLGLEHMPEGDYLCDKCEQGTQYDDQHECDSCGIRGLTDVQCGCGLHFHSDCVGVSFGSLEFLCAKCLRGDVEPKVEEEEDRRSEPVQMEEDVPVVANAESVVLWLEEPEPQPQQEPFQRFQSFGDEIVEVRVEVRDTQTPPRKKRDLEFDIREPEEAPWAAVDADLREEAPEELREEAPSPAKRRAADPSWALADPMGLPDFVPAE